MVISVRTMSRTKSKRPCSIYDRLVILTRVTLAFRTKWGTVEAKIDIGGEAAFLKRRRH